MRLSGRVALVTGSSRGIGAAVALRLARDGAKIILHGKGNIEKLEQVADKIRQYQGSASIVMGDLAERDMPAEIVRRAIAVYGSLDILINNAAIAGASPIDDITPDLVELKLNVNVRSTILSTAEFARLTSSTHGRVINLSSTAGRFASYGHSVYAATKGAIEAFTRSAALELGARGITVNAVAPGTTMTDQLTNAVGHDGMVQKLFSRWTALGRVGQPNDVADIVSFIASDDARWLTAAIIPADGGIVSTGTNIFHFSQPS
jgi:3-oxoacyl-[acyl-carrier protein] reductase